GVEVGVGGQDGQHGGHAGGEHAGALGHAADAEAVAAGNGGLVDGVGGLDRDGGLLAAVRTQPHDRLVDAGQQPVHGQPHPDQTGGGDGDLRGAVPEGGGGTLGGGVGVLEAGRPGAGVGAAGVEDDGGDPATSEHLLGPQHG